MLRDLFSLFPAYAGVILAVRFVRLAFAPFPRIRGAYQKTPRKVLRERLKKVPIKHTNRPGFRSRKPGRFCMQEAGARAVPPTLRFLAFQGKMRKQKAGSVVERRRKATLPAV